MPSNEPAGPAKLHLLGKIGERPTAFGERTSERKVVCAAERQLCSAQVERLMAGSSHREPQRDGLLRDTLLTLVVRDSMKAASAEARILDAEHGADQPAAR